MAASSRKRERAPEKEGLKQDDAPNNQKPNGKVSKDIPKEPELLADSFPDNEEDLTDSEESEYSGLSDEDIEESSDEDDDDEDDDGLSEEEDDDDVHSDSKNVVQETNPVSKVMEILKVNEYEYDSSDEEDMRNTVGNIPMKWYEDYPHIGYDLSGKKILKPQTGDELDNLIEMSENPDYWRTVKDPQTGQNIVLSREDCAIIERLQAGKYADLTTEPFDADWPDSFEKEIEIHPIMHKMADKRSFIPSKWERLKVGKMVRNIKMGWMKKPSEFKKERLAKLHEEENFYDLWSNEEENDTSRLRMHIPAPKTVLPGHAESYNPPPEYLFDKDELNKWHNTDPEERRQNFIPQKYSSMRLIPAYKKFINERFARCLDLYLCPRQQKMRMNVNPEDLIPKLPQPKDLQPFPTTEAIVYKGHTDIIRKISVDPTGQWMVSGSDDQTVKFWEVQTGRCIKTIELEDKIKFVAWSPNTGMALAAVVYGSTVLILNTELGDKLVVAQTDEMLSSYEETEVATSNSAAEWQCYEEESSEFIDKQARLKITHTKPVNHFAWHSKGDYFSVTLSDAANQSVIIHQLSKRRSQCPFSKPKGLVQCTLFHPSKPYLFVATQRYIRVYNLMKQELTKKLQSNCKWISSMAIHPGGDNVITGSYDCRLHWFDMDLSTKPYQTLKHQKKAIRSVEYHRKYPLFASTSDDGTVVICHGMVYNDLMQNPLIVPVKILRGHATTKGLNVIDCQFHPTQPWILTSGADGNIKLFS